jgi:hypothetical protein
MVTAAGAGSGARRAGVLVLLLEESIGISWWC